MKLIVEAVAIFVVSAVLLFIFAMLRSGGRATGIGVLQSARDYLHVCWRPVSFRIVLRK